MQKTQNALWLGRIAAGIPATIAFALFSLVISAILLEKELPGSLYFPLLLSAAGCSGLFGGTAATRKERKNGLINGALAAVLPCVVYLIAATAILQKFEPGSLLPCLALMTGSLVGGIIAANRKNKIQIRKKRK